MGARCACCYCGVTASRLPNGAVNGLLVKWTFAKGAKFQPLSPALSCGSKGGCLEEWKQRDVDVQET